MGSLYTIFVFIVVLGIMVFVHEFGHFIVAKKVGVKVLEFCLGMGPRLFGFKRGETEYILRAFPIGGSTKMLGEEPGETDEEQIDPSEANRAFFNQSPQKRIAITAAGPALNILLAMIVAPLIYIIGIEEPAFLHGKPFIYSVEAGSPAAQAGFKSGDEIVKVDGQDYPNWQKLTEFIALNPGKTANFEILRDGQTQNLTMTMGRDPEHGIGIAGFDPVSTNIVAASPSMDSPAKKAGLQTGDKIVAINGQKVESFEDIVTYVRGSDGKNLNVQFHRGDQALALDITPVKNNGVWIIGVVPNVPTVFVRYPIIKAIGAGQKFLVDQMVMAGIAIKKLVTGEIGRQALGGPIEIAYQVGIAARMGFTYLLKITAIICIWLGVLNLFPFPALDGGHIIFAGIEIVSRRRMPQKVVDVMNQVGFSLLMLLIIGVTMQDIWRHWGESFMKLFS